MARGKVNPLPSPEELHRLFRYAAERGVLIWNPRTDKSWKRSLDNTIAGRVTALGYVVVKVAMVQHMAHRIVWTMHHGEIPAGLDIDHRNTNRADNRLENLRLATRSQNSANSRKRADNTSGLKGVFIDPDYGYITAQRGAGGYLGRFDTVEQAHAAYMAAAREQYGEFARAG